MLATPFDRFIDERRVLLYARLALALFALHAGNLIGPWRWIYGLAAVAALYLNVFVAVAQAFQKVGRLRMLAPTQSEPPFALVQAAVLILFVLIGIVAIRKFRPPTARGRGLSDLSDPAEPRPMNRAERAGERPEPRAIGSVESDNVW